jgi:hypothetical protein
MLDIEKIVMDVLRLIFQKMLINVKVIVDGVVILDIRKKIMSV